MDVSRKAHVFVVLRKIIEHPADAARAERVKLIGNEADRGLRCRHQILEFQEVSVILGCDHMTTVEMFRDHLFHAFGISA